MNFEAFYQQLSERTRDYPEHIARFLYAELSFKRKDTCEAVYEWIISGKETEFVFENFRTTQLMKAYNMNYIAATLTMDWLKTDMEHAKIVLEMKIK